MTLGRFVVVVCGLLVAALAVAVLVATRPDRPADGEADPRALPSRPPRRRLGKRRRHLRRPRRRTRLQRAVLVINGGACLCCLLLAGLLAYANHLVREVPRLELGVGLAAEDDGAGPSGLARNYLVIGTDSADGLAEDDPIRIGRDAGVRTDTLMVIRVDPSSEQAAVLSIPRDLYVRLAGGGTGRINGALYGEGPARLLATINDALGIPIHHYVEIDFQGFRDIVGALGGVPMYFAEPVRDTHSGLFVPEPGCVVLDPTQALAYARARAYEQLIDGRWRTDPTGDLGRISRQQEFIRRVLHRAFQRGARNPLVLRDLVDTGVRAITLDSELTLNDLRAVGDRFRQFDPNDLRTYSLPVYDAFAGGAEVLRLDTTRSQPILDVFRGEDPGRVAPDNTVVQVQNGTGQAGQAEVAADALRALGFVVPPEVMGDAASFEVAATTLFYNDGDEERAALVASALAVDPIVEASNYIVGADITIVVGADWQGVGETLRPPTPGLLPVPAGSPPSTATSVPVDPSGATTTTTAPIGTVPGPDPSASC